VNEGAGIGLIVAGGLLAVLTSFGLWRRLPRAVAFGLLSASGAIVGAGALLVQEEASGAEWAITLVTLGVLAPMHARLLFGRPGHAS
jgi:multisubunit Na+/H+ antiporter MnhG subunit